MVRFDNKIYFLDLLFNGILDLRSFNCKTFSTFNFFCSESIQNLLGHPVDDVSIFSPLIVSGRFPNWPAWK